jgi:outer membrane protein OmpA-like peptidoglycan-associated protein
MDPEQAVVYHIGVLEDALSLVALSLAWSTALGADLATDGSFPYTGAGGPPPRAWEAPATPTLAPTTKVGLGLGVAAGVCFGLSQIERVAAQRALDQMEGSPVSWPYATGERDRLKAIDDHLRRYAFFGELGGGLAIGAGGLVVAGSFGTPEPGPEPVTLDGDGDGLVGEADRCPAQPETTNGYADEDGCPDELAAISLDVRLSGQPDAALVLLLTGAGGQREIPLTSDRLQLSDLLPGEYALRASDPFWEGAAQFTLEEGPNHARLDLLQIIPGTVAVSATDTGGAPLPNARARVQPLHGGTFVEVKLDDGGHGQVRVKPGDWAIFVEAPGFGVQRQEAAVVAEAVAEVAAALTPARTERSGDRIQLKETVQFGAGADTIDAVSYPMLTEVANRLLISDDIGLLEIGGHTSGEGSKAINDQLSDDRARAVMAFLKEQGVPTERMAAKGYGSSRPLVPEITEEDRATNRRVELVIVQRKEETP